MAATSFSFIQPEQYQIEPGVGYIRCMEVDEDGVTLSGAGADALGNDGGTLYEIGAVLKTDYKDTQPIETVNNEANEQIAITYGQRDMRLNMDLFGYTEYKNASPFAWFSLEKLILAKRFWKVAFYQRFKTGTNTYFIKKVFWKCIFEPKIEYVRESGAKQIFPVTIIPLIKTSAPADASGGQHFKKMRVASIMTLGVSAVTDEGSAACGMENQTEITS